MAKSREEINMLRMIKHEAEHSFLFFCMYMFKENVGAKYIPYQHLMLIAEKLEKVARGECKRLIINIFPRSGKTEMAVKLFIPWGLALNQRAKFIHLSYSGDLAIDNSAAAKEYIESEAYQNVWRMNLKVDSKAKQKWFNQKNGGCYATSTGGQITGFGAGNTTDRDNSKLGNPFKGFDGAIIIDDPNKPGDTFSDIERNKVNQRYLNTIRNRVNNPRETPIIVIQQRLHETDLSGFLLDGGSGEEWEHLNLPIIDSKGNSICPEKFTIDELIRLRESDPYSFSGQYMQEPTMLDGGIFQASWFNTIQKAELPQINSWQLYIDGAYTKNTANDPTGLLLCAKHNGNLYILSAKSKYLEMPELLKYIPKFIESNGVNVNAILIEPKASGLSMAQLLRNQTNYSIIELRGKILRESKIERASRVSPYVEDGTKVHLVEGNWNESFLQQLASFPNGKHDEYVDLLSYAIDRELFNKNKPRIIW